MLSISSRILKQQYEALFKANAVKFGEGFSARLSCSPPEVENIVVVAKASKSSQHITDAVATILGVKDSHAQRLVFAAYIDKAAEHLLSSKYIYSFVMDCL